MIYRMDYYDFFHDALPLKTFNLSKETAKRYIENPLDFVNGLKEYWDKMLRREGHPKNEMPYLKVEARDIGAGMTLVLITIPEAVSHFETPFIGITFDEEYHPRYFTFEIGQIGDDKMGYYFCEWTKDWNHINYKDYEIANVKTFVDKISEVLIYDLF